MIDNSTKLDIITDAPLAGMQCYQQPFLSVYLSDCTTLMKTFYDKQFDLAIVDVPYGIGEDGSKNHTRGKLATSKNYKGYSGNDLNAPEAEYWNELLRISKNQIVWGANHFISRLPFDSSCWIVWDKENGETDFADCELAWTSFNKAVRKFKWKWQGMLQQNMKDKQQRIHPNEKPIQLYEWLLKNYATPEMSILDTHVGSGSSRIACDKFGSSFTGYEIDKNYFEAQEKRFEEYKSQLTLFR